MFKTYSADEHIPVDTLNILIYGEPGLGKTSVSGTAGNVLHLDFDNGCHRSEFRKEVLRIKSYDDIARNRAKFLEFIADFDVIALDTVEKLLQYMITYLKNTNSDFKQARYQLKMYGALKNEANDFFQMINEAGKDIIMIAHVKEEGDAKRKVPQITGSTYDIVTQNCDLAGFLFAENDSRILNFEPSERNMGKNAAKFEVLRVPHFGKNPDWFAGLIAKAKEVMDRRGIEQVENKKKVEEAIETALKMTDIGGLNSLIPHVKDYPQAMKLQIFKAMEEKAKEFDAVFDRSAVAFVAKETPTPEPKKRTKEASAAPVADRTPVNGKVPEFNLD